MSILFLPININIPKIDTMQLPSIIMGGKYQPFWNTYSINESVDKSLEFVLSQLPFERITNIYYKEQLGPVSPHCDVYTDMHFEQGEYTNILDNEPAGYRLVLEGSSDALYIKSGETFKLAQLPSVPGCYLINSTAGVHMVKDDPRRKIIYVRGFINSDRHKALIDKSLKLYQHLAIYDF